MHSSPSKGSIVVSFLAILIISSAFLLSGVFFHSTPTRASGAMKPGVTKGTITDVPILDPATLSAKPSPRVSRSLHLKGKSNATSIQAGALPFDQRQAGTILHNFNGVGSRDSANTNFGAEFEPPDQ